MIMFKYHFVAVLAFFLTALSGCGKFIDAGPQSVAAQAAQQLEFSPFGDAAIAIDGERILVTSSAPGESGIEFRLIEGFKDTVFVRFNFSSEAPASLRLETPDGFRYASTETDRHFILGGTFSEAALIYAAGPFSMEIEFVDFGSCDDSGLVCLSNGALAYTPSSGNAAGKLLFGAMGNSHLEPTSKGSLMLEAHEDGAEYGAMLTLAPEHSGQRYILEFEVPGNNTATLRTTRNGQQRYFSAQRGWARLWDDAELVIYDRKAPSFRIRDLKLVPCTDDDWRCGSRADFQSVLPQRANESDFEYAVELLRWTTRNADYAISPSIEKDFQIESMAAWEVFFKYYQPNLAAGYCGGTAQFFARLLRENNYNAYTWNFGILQDDLTHVTTVLEMNSRFYILDPTFGGYFSQKESNSPIDVADLINGEPFGFIEVASPERDFIAASSDNQRITRLAELGVVHGCKKAGAGRTVCKLKSFGIDEYLRVTYNLLEKNALGNSHQVIVQLMQAGTFGIGNMENTDSMKAFARLLVDNGIPMIDVEGGLSPLRLLDSPAAVPAP